jgi:hypothetical protein
MGGTGAEASKGSVCCRICGTKAYVRISRQLSAQAIEQYLHCSNPRCSCVFKVLIEVTTIIKPSRLPESEQSKASKHLFHAAKFPKTLTCTSYVHRDAQNNAPITPHLSPTPAAASEPPHTRTESTR